MLEKKVGLSWITKTNKKFTSSEIFKKQKIQDHVIEVPQYETKELKLSSPLAKFIKIS